MAEDPKDNAPKPKPKPIQVSWATGETPESMRAWELQLRAENVVRAQLKLAKLQAETAEKWLRAVPPEPKTPETKIARILDSKTWLIEEFGRLKITGVGRLKITGEPMITHVAQELHDRMLVAVRAGTVKRAVSARHIETKLHDWGLWPRA